MNGYFAGKFVAWGIIIVVLTLLYAMGVLLE